MYIFLTKDGQQIFCFVIIFGTPRKLLTITIINNTLLDLFYCSCTPTTPAVGETETWLLVVPQGGGTHTWVAVEVQGQNRYHYSIGLQAGQISGG